MLRAPCLPTRHLLARRSSHEAAWLSSAAAWDRAALSRYARRVLNEPSGEGKHRITGEAWSVLVEGQQQQQLVAEEETDASFPEEPALPSHIPKMVRGFTGAPPKDVSLPVSILHSLAHIEMMAMNMYWDTVGRFSQLTDLPDEFYHDFLSVAADEARHWLMVERRLQALGSFYGQHTVHRLLWDVATRTRGDLAARIALVPLVQEARGLDAGPRLVEKLNSTGDFESCAIVQQIVDEEQRHVALGVKWFRFLAERAGLEPQTYFHQLVAQYLPNGLAPPFNDSARAACGMQPDWYLPVQAKNYRGQTGASSDSSNNKNDSTTTTTATSPSEVEGKTTSSSSSSSTVVVRKNVALFIGYVWPEHTSSAAGLRSRSIVQMLRQDGGFEVVCASGAKTTSFTKALADDFGVSTVRLQLNDSSFDELLRTVRPSVVVFDTFVVEEQYGSRVHAVVPDALTVLDTQDLHFLRKHRHDRVQQTWPDDRIASDDDEPTRLDDDDFNANEEPVVRELSSILRSDLTLVCSTYEERLLLERFRVPAEKLALASFFYGDEHFDQPVPSFEDRAHFVSIGNWLHAPNVDSVRLLHDTIWPRLRAELPGAELHVYGAHALKEHRRFNDPDRGLHLRKCKDQYAMMRRHVALLAPLRFGAGIKGKISDAFVVGTPVVTTPIGFEGMAGTERSDGNWGGFCTSTTDEFVDAALRLYRDGGVWTEKSQRARAVAGELFSYRANAPRFLEALDRALTNQQKRRKADWTRAILWDNTFRATGYRTELLELRASLATRPKTTE